MQVEVDKLQSSDGTVWDPRSPVKIVRDHAVREPTFFLHQLARSIVGGPETVAAGIEALAAETGADELMIVSDIFDHEARLRSIELIAKGRDQQQGRGQQQGRAGEPSVEAALARR